jgi:hypothetical protein
MSGNKPTRRYIPMVGAGAAYSQGLRPARGQQGRKTPDHIVSAAAASGLHGARVLRTTPCHDTA